MMLACGMCLLAHGEMRLTLQQEKNQRCSDVCKWAWQSIADMLHSANQEEDFMRMTYKHPSSATQTYKLAASGGDMHVGHFSLSAGSISIIVHILFSHTLLWCTKWILSGCKALILYRLTTSCFLILFSQAEAKSVLSAVLSFFQLSYRVCI